MSVRKIKALGAADSMKVDDGNESLDTYIRQAIGKEPLLSFPRPNDNPVQWIQLLHALDQQDLPGWPLLAPSKIPMQICDKCSLEFCSTINYRRHVRLHRRNLNLDKDSAKKSKDKLQAFWDKLCQEEAMKTMSFDDVSLEGVSGSSIVKALATFIRKPGFSFPQSYLRSGSALLDIIQGRPSRFPISSKDLFSILNDASEETFLCAGTAESLQKYVFDGEAGKIGLEMKNLVACTSFLVEQKLVRACIADKDAEALRHQKLLLEEEEAAQKRQAALLEKKKQKKLRQKEQRAKDQAYAETDDTPDDSPLPSTSTSVVTADSILETLEVPHNITLPSEPVQLKHVEEDLDKSNENEDLEDSPTSTPVVESDSVLEVPEARHNTTLYSVQIKHVEKDLDKSHENKDLEDSPTSLPSSIPVDTPDSILEVPEIPHITLSSEPVPIERVKEDLDKSHEIKDQQDSRSLPPTSSRVDTLDSILEVLKVPHNTPLSSEPDQIKGVDELDTSHAIKDPELDTSLNIDPDLGTHQNIEHKPLRRSARRRRANSHFQPKNLQKLASSRDARFPVANVKVKDSTEHLSGGIEYLDRIRGKGKVWAAKQKLGRDGENCRASLQIEEPNQHKQDLKQEVLIGSIPVTLRKRNSMLQDEHLGRAPESSTLELSTADVDDSCERADKTEAVQGTVNRSTAKHGRPVARRPESGGQLPIQNDGGACEIGSILYNGSDQVQQMCEETNASKDNLLQRGSRFSSDEVEALLAKRWKEAMESDHVKLTLFTEDSQPGCSEGDEHNQETISSKVEQHGILCSNENQMESYTNLEHLTNVKSKARAKAEKGSKVKYVPKNSGY